MRFHLAVLGLLPLAACAVQAAPPRPAPVVMVHPAPPAPPVVVMHPGPPPLRPEYVPPSPSVAYIWRPGHWAWNGARYHWVRGHYVRRHPGWHVWVQGHWSPAGIWVPAHWS
ncbi:hypothetical protein [Acidocella sp.]|uniref:hypothetical protein n=1 Tax=Acidocella sp. TaxID=50710 RepID=UPI002627B357|nr:hypothetical protein [Acidocella sp.]